MPGIGIADRFARWGSHAGNIGGGLAGALSSTASDILSAPRNLAFGGVNAGLRGMGFSELPTTGSELASNLGLDPEGFAGGGLGMLYEMATDPMTYAGGWLFGKAGGALGRMLGNPLERRAIARGPGFGGTLSKFPGEVVDDMARGGLEHWGEDLFGYGKSNPHTARLLSEVPPGSEMFDKSNLGAAWRTPQGDTVRIGKELRADIPEVAQATRRVRVGDHFVERVPYLSDVGPRMAGFQNELKDQVMARGLNPTDVVSRNTGMLRGVPTIHDPGAVIPLRPGMPMPVQPHIEGITRNGGLADKILDWMGADDLLRQSLAEQAPRSAIDRLNAYTRQANSAQPLPKAVYRNQAGEIVPQHNPLGAALDRQDMLDRPTQKIQPGAARPGGLDQFLDNIREELRQKLGRTPTTGEIYDAVPDAPPSRQPLGPQPMVPPSPRSRWTPDEGSSPSMLMEGTQLSPAPSARTWQQPPPGSPWRRPSPSPSPSSPGWTAEDALEFEQLQRRMGNRGSPSSPSSGAFDEFGNPIDADATWGPKPAPNPRSPLTPEPPGPFPSPEGYIPTPSPSPGSLEQRRQEAIQKMVQQPESTPWQGYGGGSGTVPDRLVPMGGPYPDPFEEFKRQIRAQREAFGLPRHPDLEPGGGPRSEFEQREQIKRLMRHLGMEAPPMTRPINWGPEGPPSGYSPGQSYSPSPPPSSPIPPPFMF